MPETDSLEKYPVTLWLSGASEAHVVLLALVPALALTIDRVLGEPALRWHPVAWMGHWLTWAGVRLAPAAGAPRVLSDARVFWAAALAWCAAAASIFAAAWLLQAWVLTQPTWLAALALGLFLKPMLAWAMLHDEVLAVERALAESLPSARAQLSRVVSRSVSDLSVEDVRESAIESLAENLNDSVVAPLFWFALLGLPGAALFRFANTADAMWGYRGERGGRDWTWAGKWAARADDVLGWVPARITAALIWLVGGMRGGSALAREARQTPSPNSGWPMAAMALALGVRLRKPDSYTLNSMGPRPTSDHVTRACRIGTRTTWIAVVLTTVALVLALK